MWRSAFLVVGLVVAAPAWACSRLPPEEHQLDPDSTDIVAPSTPELGDVTVRRGRGPRGGVMTSCDDGGSVGFAVSSTDDESAPEHIGYRLEFKDGDLPDRFEVTELVQRASEGGRLTLGWSDDNTHAQEPFDFTLLVYAVDEGGNESEPGEIRLSDAGSTGGCDVTHGIGGLGAAALAGLIVRRRRG